jgi:hypothetical protein
LHDDCVVPHAAPLHSHSPGEQRPINAHVPLAQSSFRSHDSPEEVFAQAIRRKARRKRTLAEEEDNTLLVSLAPSPTTHLFFFQHHAD